MLNTCERRTASKPAMSGRWMAVKFSQDIVNGIWQSMQSIFLWVSVWATTSACSLWQSWQVCLMAGLV